jgi:DNA-binding transcriptional LysR family regulator
MNLRDLDYLRSVIAHANFTRAAQAHGVSQAAISLAMRRLERELGFTLFDRQGFRRVPN